MKLAEERIAFSIYLSEHMLWLNQQPGYKACFDEVTEHVTKRDPTSDHMKNSLHHDGLAGDINLYKVVDGGLVYCSTTQEHMFSGVEWEKRNPKCRWGGWFSDGNHYSWKVDERR